MYKGGEREERCVTEPHAGGQAARLCRAGRHSTWVWSLVRISLLAWMTAEGFPDTMMVRPLSLVCVISISQPVRSMMSRTISD